MTAYATGSRLRRHSATARHVGSTPTSFKTGISELFVPFFRFVLGGCSTGALQ